MPAALVVLTTLSALAVFAADARANPLDAFGFGARGPAMGGAQTAASDDSGANYHNPALLARAQDIRIDLGYQLAVPFLRMNGGDQDVDESRGLVAGLSAPGRVAGLELALGVAVFLPDERVTRSRTLPAQRPRWILYDNRPQRIFLGASLAFRIARDFFVGAGLAFMSRTEGAVELKGRVGVPDPDDSELDLAIDVDLVTVRYPHAGVLWRARPWLDVGLSYRHEFQLSFDQSFRISGDVGAEGTEPIIEDGYLALTSRALDLFQPATVTAGLSARLTRRVLVAFDLAWQRWSTFANPAARIEIDADLGEYDDLVTIPQSPPLVPARFHDVIVPRLGVEATLAATARAVFRARAGYAYEPSPAPEQGGETNFVDNDKHTASLGAGVELSDVTDLLPRPFDLDAYVAATFLPERAHRKLSPVDPVGDYVSSGRVIAGGILTRWRF